MSVIADSPVDQDWGTGAERKKEKNMLDLLLAVKKIEECLGNTFKNEVSSVSFSIP